MSTRATSSCTLHTAEMEYHVRILHQMYEDLDPMILLKTAKDRRHMAMFEGSSLRSMPYTASCMVRAVLFSSMLRDAGTTKEALLRGIRLVLPDSLVSHIEKLFTPLEHLIPSKPTIARWRSLLDGSFMLWSRQKLQERIYLGTADTSWLTRRPTWPRVRAHHDCERVARRLGGDA